MRKRLGSASHTMGATANSQSSDNRTELGLDSPTAARRGRAALPHHGGRPLHAAIGFRSTLEGPHSRCASIGHRVGGAAGCGAGVDLSLGCSAGRWSKALRPRQPEAAARGRANAPPQAGRGRGPTAAWILNERASDTAYPAP